MIMRKDSHNAGFGMLKASWFQMAWGSGTTLHLRAVLDRYGHCGNGADKITGLQAQDHPPQTPSRSATSSNPGSAA
jgi:hypothetical protein